MLYDRVFFVVWSTVLSIMLLIFGLERFDISLEQTIRNRTIVYFSSPPLSSFGERASFIQQSNRGVISDAGFPQFMLELVKPKPFTQIVIDESVVRNFMHQGVFSKSFSEFFGSDTAFGVLKFSDAERKPQELYVWLGYPDYDQSSYTMVYQFRPAVQDEIPRELDLKAIDPGEILRGNVSNIRLQVLAPLNG